MITLLAIFALFSLFLFLLFIAYSYGLYQFDWRVAFPITEEMILAELNPYTCKVYHTLNPEVMEWCKQNGVKAKIFYYYKGTIHDHARRMEEGEEDDMIFVYSNSLIKSANYIRICNFINNKKYATIFKMRWG